MGSCRVDYSLFARRETPRGGLGTHFSCLLAVLLLAQLAVPARPVAAEPGPDLSDIAWSRLMFVATEAASEVSAEVRLTPVPSNELRDLLPATAEGPAPLAPDAQVMMLTGLVKIDRFDKSFRTDVWFLPRGSTALKRRRLKTGKEPSLQTFWYQSEGVRRERADPNSRSEVELPPDQWTKVREHFYAYGPPKDGCTTLTDPLVLVLVAWAAAGPQATSQDGLCAFNKKTLYQAAWAQAETRDLEVDFKVLGGDSPSRTKGRVAARQVVLRARAAYGAGRKPDPFEVFEMSGGIEIWLDESSGLPLRINGQVSGIGTVSFVLTEATLQP